MKKVITASSGDLIKIPLPDGTHTYARILIDGSYALYDAKIKEEVSDLYSIVQKPILFIAKVDVFGLKEGKWTIIGNIPLDEKLSNFYPKYFNPLPTTLEYINFYESNRDEIEEAIKKDWIGFNSIQIDGIHGSIHIEKRLMDYYEGKRNVHNRNAIFSFKKILGLPLDNV